MGFVGTILVKSAEDQKALVEFGPLEILKAVTFPCIANEQENEL